MKRLFVIFALVWAFVAMSVVAAPRHRNHLSGSEAVATSNGSNAVEAFSDTTSNDAWAGTADSTMVDDFDSQDIDDMAESSVDSLRDSMFGVFGGFAAISALLALLFILLFPIILIIILLRYLTRRRNAKIALAEKALASGQEIPTQLYAPYVDSNERLWRRGIKNLAVGVGLFLMFWIWGSSVLMGVGVLVACYGAGQLVIVRTTGGRDKKDDKPAEEQLNETPQDGEQLDD